MIEIAPLPESPKDEQYKAIRELYMRLIAQAFMVPGWPPRKGLTMWDRPSQKGNAWIDEHVMGEEMIDLLPGEMGFGPLGTTTTPGRYQKWDIGRETGVAKHVRRSPSYTALSDDALCALEKFLERDTYFVELSHAGAQLSWQCALIPKKGERIIITGHGTFCLAICSAIYRAITKEVEK